MYIVITSTYQCSSHFVHQHHSVVTKHTDVWLALIEVLSDLLQGKYSDMLKRHVTSNPGWGKEGYSEAMNGDAYYIDNQAVWEVGIYMPSLVHLPSPFPMHFQEISQGLPSV